MLSLILLCIVPVPAAAKLHATGTTDRCAAYSVIRSFLLPASRKKVYGGCQPAVTANRKEIVTLASIPF
jgi:hypothetical protein